MMWAGLGGADIAACTAHSRIRVTEWWPCFVEIQERIDEEHRGCEFK